MIKKLTKNLKIKQKNTRFNPKKIEFLLIQPKIDDNLSLLALEGLKGLLFNKIIILNFHETTLSATSARRIADYLTGVTTALFGAKTIVHINNRIFFFLPKNFVRTKKFSLKKET
uniref:Cell division protein SepF n=1 Tax=Gloeochaete wittrockiana TaxID=38269 RepID=A0A3G1IWC3_9EUKA|nr:protein of unknown function DUF552 [Gloeochaete wittrockiana]ASQ40262.1 protein of unknown function DUF552 [Gloeochaete wittrockiana]